MKRIFILMIIVLGIVTVASAGYIKDWIYPEKVVSKNINIRILQANTYGYHAYSHSSAKLAIVVILLRDQHMDTLLVKEYPVFKLQNLPVYSKEFEQHIYIPDIADKTEKIIFLYTVSYNSTGNILQVPVVNYIGEGSTNDDFLIKI